MSRKPIKYSYKLFVKMLRETDCLLVREFYFMVYVSVQRTDYLYNRWWDGDSNLSLFGLIK